MPASATAQTETTRTIEPNQAGESLSDDGRSCSGMTTLPETIAKCCTSMLSIRTFSLHMLTEISCTTHGVLHFSKRDTVHLRRLSVSRTERSVPSAVRDDGLRQLPTGHVSRIAPPFALSPPPHTVLGVPTCCCNRLFFPSQQSGKHRHERLRSQAPAELAVMDPRRGCQCPLLAAHGPSGEAPVGRLQCLQVRQAASTLARSLCTRRPTEEAFPWCTL